jgi:hypothetical protein
MFQIRCSIDTICISSVSIFRSFVQWHGLSSYLLPDPQISESMLISCGMDNKFVLAQNVMVDQESCE